MIPATILQNSAMNNLKQTKRSESIDQVINMVITQFTIAEQFFKLSYVAQFHVAFNQIIFAKCKII